MPFGDQNFEEGPAAVVGTDAETTQISENKDSVFDTLSVSGIADWAKNVSELISQADADAEPNTAALTALSALNLALQNYENAGEGDRSMFEGTIKEKARELHSVLKKGQ